MESAAVPPTISVEVRNSVPSPDTRMRKLGQRYYSGDNKFESYFTRKSEKSRGSYMDKTYSSAKKDKNNDLKF